MSENLALSAPWVGFSHEMEEMFGYDPEIEVVSDMSSDDPVITLYVNNAVKAEALTKLLPGKKDFGNISVKIMVKPANNEDTAKDILWKAFAGNPVFSDIITMAPGGIYTDQINYVEFINEVVQYWDDRLDDPNGYTSTLYEDIARDIFDGIPGVCYCTATDE